MDGAVDLTVVADANLQRIIWKDEEEEEVEFYPVEQFDGLHCHWLLAAPLLIQRCYDFFNHDDAIPGDGLLAEEYNDIWMVMSILAL